MTLSHHKFDVELFAYAMRGGSSRRIDLTAPVLIRGKRKGVAIGRAYMDGGNIIDVEFRFRAKRWVEQHPEAELQQIGDPRPDLIRLMPLSPTEEAAHA